MCLVFGDAGDERVQKEMKYTRADTMFNPNGKKILNNNANAIYLDIRTINSAVLGIFFRMYFVYVPCSRQRGKEIECKCFSSFRLVIKT